MQGVRAQLSFNGVDLDLGSQLICIMGLEFPTMGGPVLRDPSTLSWFYTPFSLPHKAAPFSLLVWSRFSFSFLSRIANPTSPLILLFIALDKWSCYDYSPLLVRIGVQFRRL